MADFPTRDVVSIVINRNLLSMEGVYTILDYMAGESISGLAVAITVGLPQAKEVLLKEHPQLAVAIKESEAFMDVYNIQEWIENWETRYGKTLSVPANSLSASWKPVA